MRNATTHPPSFDWAALVVRVIHPIKVAVVEAMLWIDRPLAPSELECVFEGQFSLGSIGYHVQQLAKLGVIQEVSSEQVRGVTKTYYCLAG